MGALDWAFKGEDTLRPGSLRSDSPAASSSSAACSLLFDERPLAFARAAIDDAGCVILPGGFAIAVPEEGRVLTVEMDRGYIVHVERSGADAVITVDAPAEVAAPIDDAGLARLAVESRENATGNDNRDKSEPAARALRRAWSYRRAFERLAEGFAGDDGGPVVPVRWTTLSYEGRVHVPGIGTIDVDDAGCSFVGADGRTVHVRRIGSDDEWAPVGSVEVVVTPKKHEEITVVEKPVGRTRVKTSPKVVPL